MSTRFPITEHVAKSERHTTFYLACGPSEGTPIIFVHGWPELSSSWRHQLPVFGALGLRAVAPDMRGYGCSTVYDRHEDYSQEAIAQDMLALLDAIGAQSAIWVGHDWGSPVVWSLAQHHPDRCLGVASLCVPYQPKGFTAENSIELADRSVYPEAEFPAAQWDYQLFYRERFADACAELEADVRATVKLLFRSGDPSGLGKPSPTAFTRRNGGWFGPGKRAPDLPRDQAVLTAQDEDHYTAALERNGFFGPCSWYMNGERNAAYAAKAAKTAHLPMPVLFLHGKYDNVCETLESRLADPMRAHCEQLQEVTVESGHWMAQEKPIEVNAALARWLSTALADHW